MLTRRNFIKLAVMTGTSGIMTTLMGCGKKSIKAETLREYEIIIFDIASDEEKTKIIEEINEEQYKKLTGEHALLIYTRYDRYPYRYWFSAWNYDSTDINLTSSYYTEEEAEEELAKNFNIVFRDSALKYLIATYGVKNSYTPDEIKDLLDGFSTSLESPKKKAKIK